MRPTRAPPVLFVVQVKVGSTGTVPLEVRLGDDIPSLVDCFCKLYRLGDRQRHTLGAFIENKLVQPERDILDLDKALAAPRELDSSTDRQLLEEMAKDTYVSRYLPMPVHNVVVKDELKKSRATPTEPPRYEQLYRLSKVLRERSAEKKRLAEKNLTFRPDISRSAAASQYYERPRSVEFQARMEEDIRLRAERSRTRESQRESVPAAKPRLSHQSRNSTERPSRPPAQTAKALYDLAAAKLERRSFVKQQVDRHMEQMRSARKMNEASSTMVEGIETRQIQELFAKLDHDHDGLICAQRVGIDNINNAKLAILCPLLEEMQEKQVSLDLGAFSRAVSRLLARIPIQERRCLLGLEEEKAHNCGVNALPSFTPAICANTNKILKRAKSPSDRRSLSEEKYKKMMQEIEVKRQQELAECRFKPDIFTKSYKVSTSAYSSAH